MITLSGSHCTKISSFFIIFKPNCGPLLCPALVGLSVYEFETPALNCWNQYKNDICQNYKFERSIESAPRHCDGIIRKRTASARLGCWWSSKSVYCSCWRNPAWWWCRRRRARHWCCIFCCSCVIISEHFMHGHLVVPVNFNSSFCFVFWQLLDRFWD